VNVTVQQGSIDRIAADAVAVNLFQGARQPAGATGAIDQALGGEISDILAGGDFKGELGDVLVLYTRGRIPTARVIVVGLGPRANFGPEQIRRAAATAAARALKLGVRRLATITHGAGIGGIDPEAAAQATVEGSLLGLYAFREYKTDDEDTGEITDLVIVERSEPSLDALRAGAAAGEAIAAGVVAARDLENHPANRATPSFLAEHARGLAERYGMRVDIWDRDRIRSAGMGALTAVAAGATESPRFIVVEYAAEGHEHDAPLVVAGKAITFDTGGISIKPSLGMHKMKFDMGGGGAVLGALEAIGRLQLPARVVGLVAAAENMPGAGAARPGDIVTALNGTTIEILNTDAEGRLVLADSLSYAQTLEPKPEAVVDLATLTGAIIVTLGHAAAGLFSNDDALSRELVAAGDRTGERLWRLPTWEVYGEAVKSDVADIKNVTGKRPSPAGSIFAAKFLERFVDYPWAHLDIAGVGWDMENVPYVPPGGTGFGVRLLVDWLRARTAGSR
jgi:leucyl aminopeptidase